MFGASKAEIWQAKLEGIQLALDYMVRGLAPHFEDENHNPPPEVVAAIHAVEGISAKNKTPEQFYADFLMGIHAIGEAIGKACAQKAKADSP